MKSKGQDVGGGKVKKVAATRGEMSAVHERKNDGGRRAKSGDKVGGSNGGAEKGAVRLGRHGERNDGWLRV